MRQYLGVEPTVPEEVLQAATVTSTDPYPSSGSDSGIRRTTRMSLMRLHPDGVHDPHHDPQSTPLDRPLPLPYAEALQEGPVSGVGLGHAGQSRYNGAEASGECGLNPNVFADSRRSGDVSEVTGHDESVYEARQLQSRPSTAISSNGLGMGMGKERIVHAPPFNASLPLELHGYRIATPPRSIVRAGAKRTLHQPSRARISLCVCAGSHSEAHPFSPPPPPPPRYQRIWNRPPCTQMDASVLGLCARVVSAYDGVRAMVLHLLLPAQGSVWRRARDWKWWAWQVAGATPVLGPCLWLLQLVLLDKRDEW